MFLWMKYNRLSSLCLQLPYGLDVCQGRRSLFKPGKLGRAFLLEVQAKELGLQVLENE